MFAKSIIAALSVFALASSEVAAKPVSVPRSAELARRQSFPSFNSYGGFSSMSNFDEFFGQDNFDSSENVQIIVQEEVEICESVSIDIVQQRLVILSEVVKEVILQMICEVEVQEIVIEQFTSIFSSFSNDVSHNSDRSASFDSTIVEFYEEIFESDGSLSTNDFGFDGSSVGQNSVIVGGNNWNDASSPSSVSSAKSLAIEAASA